MTDSKILLLGDQLVPGNLHQLWPSIPFDVLSQPLNCSLASLKLLYPFCCVLYFGESSEQVIQAIGRIRNLYPDVPQVWVSPKISPEDSVAAFRAGVHDILFQKEASEVETYIAQLVKNTAEVQIGRGIGKQQNSTLYLETKEILAAYRPPGSDFIQNEKEDKLLRMRCFGTFGMSYQGQVLSTSMHHREKSLLAYLLLRGHRPIHKDRLAEAFWPDTSTASSKNLLHVAISRVRKWAISQQLPAHFLEYENNCYTISRNLRIETDYGLFRSYYREVQRTEHNKPELVLPHILQAYQLYTDILLEDIYSEDWVHDMQNQAADTYIGLMHQLGETLHRLNWFDLAIHADERLLQIDPMAEQAYHRLMHAYSQLGWRNKVVQCYQKYKNTIAEIQLQPAPEIIASMALLTGVECL